MGELHAKHVTLAGPRRVGEGGAADSTCPKSGGSRCNPAKCCTKATEAGVAAARRVEESRAELHERNIYAGGGHGGAKARSTPLLEGEWVPGKDPCHWTEVPRSTRMKQILLRFLTALQLAGGVVYLQYRLRETIGTVTRSPYLIAYQVYFVCLEVFGAFQGLFQLMEAWMAIGRNSVSLRNIPNELLVTQSDFGRPQRSPRVKRRHSNYPSIGIFIPCFNEDTNLVRKTILGVLNLDCPKELLSVYLCDDGRDESKRDMMEELGQQRRGYDLHWVVRPDEKHAKAGNLNHCIAKSRTTLIMSLDADFVPRRNFLQRLVPYFYNLNEGTGRYEFNEDLAAVQTPQHFRNLSPYDSDPLDQRSTFFFDYIMPSKDYFNAAPIIGTNNLLNRRVLGDVGYYPHVSVTEDSALSISLHKRGFRTYYVRESLATGLATEAMWSNLRQRARWLMGDFQLLFALRDGPFCKGLKWSQRMFYIRESTRCPPRERFARARRGRELRTDASPFMRPLCGRNELPSDDDDPAHFAGGRHRLVPRVLRLPAGRCGSDQVHRLLSRACCDASSACDGPDVEQPGPEQERGRVDHLCDNF
jgi:cellulose synthase/poly-beta-1,6-N-acetylglucosamine synthase-like glycosyltransferase